MQIEIEDLQKKFFYALKNIQEGAVYTTIASNKEQMNAFEMESLLFDATFETIINFLELIDGYYNEDLKLDIIERDGKRSLKDGIELHDKCVEYLRFGK